MITKTFWRGEPFIKNGAGEKRNEKEGTSSFVLPLDASLFEYSLSFFLLSFFRSFFRSFIEPCLDTLFIHQKVKLS